MLVESEQRAWRQREKAWQSARGQQSSEERRPEQERTDHEELTGKTARKQPGRRAAGRGQHQPLAQSQGDG